MNLRFALLGVSMAALPLLPAPALAGVGEKYGSRDPVTCVSATEPVNGAPSMEQVKRYLACALEEEHLNSLRLITNLIVAVGSGQNADTVAGSLPGIDRDKLVYPLAGSYTSVMCGLQTAANVGRNCWEYDIATASGNCWRRLTGDWICLMTGFPGTPRHDVPPPM
jgi:hypothetical protein